MQIIDPAQASLATQAQSLLTTQISAIAEALKFQYGLITLLMAGVGFRYAKAAHRLWSAISRTVPAREDVGDLRRWRFVGHVV
jgi:hypothetical protein